MEDALRFVLGLFFLLRFDAALSFLSSSNARKAASVGGLYISSVRYWIGTSGAYFFDNSTCLIVLKPGAIIVSGVSCSRVLRSIGDVFLYRFIYVVSSVSSLRRVAMLVVAL